MGEELSPFPRNLPRDSRIPGKGLAGLSPLFALRSLPIFPPLPLPLRRLLLRPRRVPVWGLDLAPPVGVAPYREGLGLSVVLSSWASVETRSWAAAGGGAQWPPGCAAPRCRGCGKPPIEVHRSCCVGACPCPSLCPSPVAKVTARDRQTLAQGTAPSSSLPCSQGSAARGCTWQMGPMCGKDPARNWGLRPGSIALPTSSETLRSLVSSALQAPSRGRGKLEAEAF